MVNFSVFFGFLGEPEKNSLFLRKNRKRRLAAATPQVGSLSGRNCLSENFIFSEKRLGFFIKHECVKGFPRKYMNNRQQWDSNLPPLDFPPRLHSTQVLCKTPTTLRMIRRVMGNTRKKEKLPITEKNHLLSENHFDGKEITAIVAQNDSSLKIK